MRKTTTILISISILFVLGYCFTASQNIKNWLFTSSSPVTPEEDESNSTVQIALLLDTSGSMDGLIEQAKSQLWKIVNELSEAEHSNETPNLEIALYEYGNDRLARSDGFIRQITSFTRDMDLVSEQLFSLSTNGGSEFCGQVISTSLKEMDWSNETSDLKLIYIAGNEAFNQGPIPYQMACEAAKSKDVIVNTIFCGDRKSGITGFWKEAANLAGGNYMNIDHNQATRYIDSPYDDEIADLNERLNTTYIPYGEKGQTYFHNQQTQDNNANTYSKANKVDRTVFKSSKNYDNKKWDLVDAYKKDKKIVQKQAELPKEFKGKSKKEVEALVNQKLGEREHIQKQIKALAKQRKGYIATENAKLSTDSASLESGVIATVKEQAQKKGYKFKE